MDRAVFLDRDGTLIEDVGYAHEPTQVKFLPRVSEAIRLLNEAGFKVLITTNQSGVARGYFTEETLRKLNDFIGGELAAQGAVIDRVYYCPHHVDGTITEYRKACHCRKPEPGMIEQAVAELDIDLKKSFAVGDKPLDVEAGRRVGCRTVLLSADGHGVADVTADHVAADLYGAVEWLLKVASEENR